jgi:hypothetical protein
VLGQVDELWAAVTLVFGDEDIEQRPSSSCGGEKSAAKAVQEEYFLVASSSFLSVDGRQWQ